MLYFFSQTQLYIYSQHTVEKRLAIIHILKTACSSNKSERNCHKKTKLLQNIERTWWRAQCCWWRIGVDEKSAVEFCWKYKHKKNDFMWNGDYFLFSTQCKLYSLWFGGWYKIRSWSSSRVGGSKNSNNIYCQRACSVV